jgi:hypothetical protein
VTHGCKVRKESAGQSREDDARTEARHAQERRLGQEGDQPQTSDRYRPLRSTPRRRQGAAGEEVIFEEEVEFEEIIEEVQLEEVVFKEVIIEKVYKEVFEEEVAADLSAYICVNLRIKPDPQITQMYAD